jgi:mTERF domain-containing protein
VHRPALFTYSIKRRLIPRHYVLKVLKEKELVKKDLDFFVAVSRVEEIFVKRFIEPYKDSVPGFANGYAAAYAEQQQKSSF